MLMDVEAHVPVWRRLEVAVMDVVTEVHYRRLQVVLREPFRFGYFSPQLLLQGSV